jgi:hypothetical protein
MAMITSFGLKRHRHSWINYTFVIVLAGQTVLAFASAEPLGSKIFFTLLTLTAITVELFVRKKRRLAVG